MSFLLYNYYQVLLFPDESNRNGQKQTAGKTIIINVLVCRQTNKHNVLKRDHDEACNVILL